MASWSNRLRNFRCAVMEVTVASWTNIFTK